MSLMNVVTDIKNILTEEEFKTLYLLTYKALANMESID